MTDREVTVRRARAEGLPGTGGSGRSLFAGDGGPRDPCLDPDPARLLLAALYGGEVVGYLSGPSASRRGNRARHAPR